MYNVYVCVYTVSICVFVSICAYISTIVTTVLYIYELFSMVPRNILRKFSKRN